VAPVWHGRTMRSIGKGTATALEDARVRERGPSIDASPARRMPPNAAQMFTGGEGME